MHRHWEPWDSMWYFYLEISGSAMALKARGLVDSSAQEWSRPEYSITFCSKDTDFCTGLGSDITCILLLICQIVGKSPAALSIILHCILKHRKKQLTAKNSLGGTLKRDVTGTEKSTVVPEFLGLACNRPQNNNVIWKPKVLRILSAILDHVFCNCGWGGRLQLSSFLFLKHQRPHHVSTLMNSYSLGNQLS